MHFSLCSVLPATLLSVLSFILYLILIQVPLTKSLVHVLKVITVHALVQVAITNVVVFLDTRLSQIHRVSVDVMVYVLCSSYGFSNIIIVIILMQTSMNVHKVKIFAKMVLVLILKDPSFAYVLWVLSSIQKSRGVLVS